jgi:hypothetical protein
LLKNNYIPIIASDGIALALLRKEFPGSNTLPSYHVEYAENGPILNETNTEWPKKMKSHSAGEKNNSRLG